jgi:hypothetical protein
MFIEILFLLILLWGFAKFILANLIFYICLLLTFFCALFLILLVCAIIFWKKEKILWLKVLHFIPPIITVIVLGVLIKLIHQYWI